MEKFIEANHPYYIRSDDKTIDDPINTMDCIRIFEKLNELKEKKPDCRPTLWSPLHYATFNIKDMTVVFDIKPKEILNLVRGKTYYRPRGKYSMRNDPSNCNLKGNWPSEAGEFAKLWAENETGDEESEPSIKEVVMGIYHHHMAKVEENFKEIIEKHPERL